MKPKQLLYLLFFLLAGLACKKNTITRLDTDGEFIVNFDVPNGEVFAPAKVVLTNRTKNAESFSWKFDEVMVVSGKDTSKASSSASIIPDTLLYQLPGSYKIILSARQGGKEETVERMLVIKKRLPAIIVPENIAMKREAQFSARVFEYPGKPITYKWNFGDGAESVEAAPNHKYENEGDYTVTLTINDGVETLTATVQVHVLGEVAKTIYFTDMLTKKLVKFKFTQFSVSTPVVMDVNIGLHPLAVNIHDDKVVISDAGVGVMFSSGNADGRIFRVGLDGTNDVTITRGAGTYVNDPFISTVDNGKVYWLDRYQGIRVLPVTEVDAAYPAPSIKLVAADVGGVNPGTWTDGGVQFVDGVLWYSKHGTGKGLYKKTATGFSVIPGLKELKIRSFAVDTKFNKIYFVISVEVVGTEKPGLYVCNMDGSNIQLIDQLATFSEEGGAGERTSVTGIAIDSDPDDGTAGYLYYGYRDKADISSTGAIVGNGSKSGVKRYALDRTKAPELFLPGYIPYGIGIDQTRR